MTSKPNATLAIFYLPSILFQTVFFQGPDIQKHPKEDLISYNAVISSCEKFGKWQHALSAFAAMGLVKVQGRVGTAFFSAKFVADYKFGVQESR